MSYAYLAVLLFSLTGLALIDYRYRLAFFENRMRAAAAVFLPVLFFLLWDAAGIVLGIFFRGQTAHLTGILLAPELPLEEPLFLALLCSLFALRSLGDSLVVDGQIVAESSCVLDLADIARHAISTFATEKWLQVLVVALVEVVLGGILGLPRATMRLLVSSHLVNSRNSYPLRAFVMAQVEQIAALRMDTLSWPD